MQLEQRVMPGLGVREAIETSKQQQQQQPGLTDGTQEDLRPKAIGANRGTITAQKLNYHRLS